MSNQEGNETNTTTRIKNLKDSLFNLEKDHGQLREKLDVANKEIFFIQNNQKDEFTQLLEQKKMIDQLLQTVAEEKEERIEVHKRLAQLEQQLQKPGICEMASIKEEDNSKFAESYACLTEGNQMKPEKLSKEHEAENGQENPNAEQQPTRYKIITFKFNMATKGLKNKAINHLITEHKPHLIFVQECPDPALNSPEYKYLGQREAGLIYNENYMKIEDINFNFEDDRLKSFREANLENYVYLCKVKYTPLHCRSLEFIGISWQTRNNQDESNGVATDYAKAKYSSQFLTLLTVLSENMDFPLLVGGFFQTDFLVNEGKKTETNVLKIHECIPYKNMINYFMSKKNLSLLEPHWFVLPDDVMGKPKPDKPITKPGKPIGLNIDWRRQ